VSHAADRFSFSGFSRERGGISVDDPPSRLRTEELVLESAKLLLHFFYAGVRSDNEVD
jgi:hypothetical protein